MYNRTTDVMLVDRHGGEAATIALAANTGGKVGIGTTSPSSLLHLSSPNSIDLKLFSSAAGGYSRLFFGAGTNGARWNGRMRSCRVLRTIFSEMPFISTKATALMKRFRTKSARRRIGHGASVSPT